MKENPNETSNIRQSAAEQQQQQKQEQEHTSKLDSSYLQMPCTAPPPSLNHATKEIGDKLK